MSLAQTIYGIETEPYNIYAAKQRWGIGQKMELPDGRIYRGTLNGTVALESGILCQALVEATFTGLAIQTAIAVGDTTIKLTQATTFLNEDEAVNGFVAVFTQNSANPPTVGQTFRIFGNTATASGTTTLTITLFPNIAVLEAVPVSNGAGNIVRNPYSQVLVCPTSTTQYAVGVSLVDVTGSYYCWLQTRGVCGLLVDDGAAFDPGTALAPPDSGDAGAAMNADGTARQIIGTAFSPGTTDTVGLCFLAID
ncbi:hypothetical protein LCGC14_3080190 [marine sediment metagenome]|uniref:Uncharacterized protein n=1 Tax=marine sediment metagenome TaxID=412755 RepID=A0A0F8X247_9ZZZZ